MRAPLTLSLPLLLAACAPEAPEPAPGPGHLDHSTAPLILDHEASLRFQADGNTTTENLPVYAGGRLRLVYDPLRLPACRAGSPSLFARIEVLRDGAAVEEQVRPLNAHGRLFEAVWAVPEDARGLRLRFLATDAEGCQEADDGPGSAGYAIETPTPAPPGVLRFDAGWTHGLEGALHPGGLMQIDYAPQRLPACRSRAYGGRAWNILASWRFSPGGQTGQASLFIGSFYDDAAAFQRPVVAVPEDASSVALWFSNSDRGGCVGWDSAFGADYHFPVIPGPEGLRVGWAGAVAFIQTGQRRESLGDLDPAWYWDRWQGEPRSSEIEAQVWIPGLTDQVYPDAAARRAAADAVFAVAETDAVPGDLPGGFGELPLRFLEQRGNNFVFSLPLVNLRGPGARIQDGLYHYRLAFSVDGGRTRTHVTRADGGDRRFVLAADVACALFPDHPPPECPARRPVDWAGDLGARRGGACAWQAGVEDPVTFTKSALGSDCMVITADVYVAGLTDAGGDPRSLWARVETDLEVHRGPLPEPRDLPLRAAGRVGNNYRFDWYLAEYIGRADRGDYRYRIKFSADQGLSWRYAEDGAWRRLRIRNDSQDRDDPPPAEDCVDLSRFEGPGNQWPACLPYAVAEDFDARHCELYVNAIGRGQFSQAQANEAWLEIYLRVRPDLGGEILEAGVFARWTEGGAARSGFVLGTEIEPHYWRTGLVTHSNARGIARQAESLAFFVDVLRPDGRVERLWESAGGADYAVDAAFAVPGFVLGIGSGQIEYAAEQGAWFASRARCAP